jgi:hypothetical protein
LKTPLIFSRVIKNFVLKWLFFQEVQKSWKRKAAEEADLVISDDSEDEAFANSDQKSAVTKSAIQVRSKPKSISNE